MTRHVRDTTRHAIAGTTGLSDGAEGAASTPLQSAMLGVMFRKLKYATSCLFVARQSFGAS
jgi:hypothetical protein